jgi:short-subunit dehydrogenase
VTGASAGIGEAFAHALGADGAHVILVSRRGERLQSLATRLTREYGVDAFAIAADLSQPGEAARVGEEAMRRAPAVDILISNAGRRDPGRFEERGFADHRSFLTLTIGAGAELTRLVLPGMQARGFGRIVHVASVAALLPGSADRTLYAAGKAFLVSFSQSLAAENRGRGVNFCALCPGFTYSEFHPAAARGLRRLQFMQPQAVARTGLRAAEAGRAVAVPGLYNKAVVAIANALPRAVAGRLVGVTRRGRRAAERRR